MRVPVNGPKRPCTTLHEHLPCHTHRVGGEYSTVHEGVHQIIKPDLVCVELSIGSLTGVPSDPRFQDLFRRPNAYGLFFGGSDLAGPNQRYSYFVIRENGQFLIRKRVGSDTSDVVSWSGHDAINELDAQGRATNTLTVEVGSDRVRFLVNGTEVSTQPRSTVDTDGITGLRVNHFLNVHIDNLTLGPTRLA